MCITSKSFPSFPVKYGTYVGPYIIQVKNKATNRLFSDNFFIKKKKKDLPKEAYKGSPIAN